jgi:3'(2'), 5'-bisphosphate nucleotidase
MTAYARERKIAELAVRRASLLTNSVYHSRVKGTVTKEDKSPVTSTPLSPSPHADTNGAH